ncbi:PilW family protein [Legionella nagasakiensis]|uniref:PilW family protein n=1 Tax=Legionella nagasakiensis TaxID=535290 RepID=UPI0010551B0D|nr:PilW family protein [Legionella nagasakiensis]
MNFKKHSNGFSIIEFMIAITLGALLVATTGSIYLSNKANYQIQTGLARLQENARYANYFLTREIRMAGYQGCASEEFAQITNRVKTPSVTLLYDKPLLGFDGLSGSFSPTLPSNLTGKVLPDTDVLEIRMASNTNVQLRDDMNQTNNPILVYDRLGIQAGEVVMISNCLVGDIFIAGGNTNATAITHTVNENTSNDLSAPYIAGAHVMRYVYYAFYIKNTGRTNASGQPIYALIRQDINGNEVEIVEGVEQMRILYGVDTNDDKTADHYQSATEVNSSNNWNNVISLKINLLFSTIENVASRPQSYQFNGASYTPTDRKLRREWQSFVTIRNRGLPS